MTTRSDMTAAGLRLLDLLTVSEAAVRLRCSAKMVRRLVAEGVLAEERFGALVRITPESVAAYKHQASGRRRRPGEQPVENSCLLTAPLSPEGR